MKMPRKSISEFPHKWKFAENTSEQVVIIDNHNSNFRDSGGAYCARCLVQYSGQHRYIRYAGAIWIID